MTLQVIGLTGLKESGKDTVFQLIQEFLPHAKRYAFADRLKDCMYILNPYVRIDHNYHHYFQRLQDLVDNVGWDVAKKQADVRTLLQVFGTEVVRDNIEDGLWARLVCEQITADHNTRAAKKLAVVTDVRFNNEAAQLRNRLDAHVWQITRPGKKGDGHRSEKGIDAHLVEMTLGNNSDLENLRTVVKLGLIAEGLL